MGDNPKRLDYPRFLVIAVLLLICAGLEYYFHSTLEIYIAYTHLFYLPIVLAAIWWGLMGGFPVSLILAFLHTRSDLPNVEFSELSRSLVFILIGSVLGIVSDGRKRAEEEIKEYSERLEEMVEERTKELRDAQEELIRKERLAVLGQLAGGVGHELRNPLGVISNAIYYLQTILPDIDETTKEYLEIISSEVRNSTKIVSDLLDLSRAKPAEKEEIAVSDLVAHLWEKQPPPEKVKVTTKIASGLLPIFVDPRQIEQVLTNLVINAYEAMPEGGRLTVKTKGEKGQVHLSITDTGYGISKEKMERLFEPLFTTKTKGIGLGLAVSKNLVEVNGGRIEVKSEEGKGSTFTIILPTKGVQA